MNDHPAHSRKTSVIDLPKIEPGFSCRTPKYRLDSDLVLSATTKLQIDEALAKLRYHRTIYDDWQFSTIDPLGAGTILNFYGPPGTGKTMAGEAFAGTLERQLIHLGIAELESKFMGETAKNIQNAFRIAEANNAVIFFDEADTLLGKRLSNVTQGIDNEINSMRSTLLIELERFKGVAIFATNFAQNYDEAFRSRISHHVRFDLPDEEARSLLWQKMLIPSIPLEDDRDEILTVCLEQTSGFSGREIRTCMRLALPKALLESERQGTQAGLKIMHLIESITQVRKANEEVAISPANLGATNASRGMALLGIANNNQGN